MAARRRYLNSRELEEAINNLVNEINDPDIDERVNETVDASSSGKFFIYSCIFLLINMF